MGSRDAFRSIFALEEQDSSQIDPCAAGKGPQFMLPLASVAGLVVPGVEAELEDGGLDIVSFVLLLLGDVFHPLSGPHRFQLLGQEVPPLVLGPVSRIGNAERSAPCPFGLIDLPGPRVGDSDRVTTALVQQVVGLAALDADEHAVDRKRPVVGILVGPVAVDGLDGGASRRLALGDGLLVSGRHLAVLNNVLFIEHLFKKPVLGLHAHQDSVDDTPQFSKALLDGLGVAPVHGLLRVLLQPRLHLLPQRRVQAAHVLPNLLKEGLVDKLVAGIPGNIAADEFAVHPHRFAGNLELRSLELRQAAEAGLHQVLTSDVSVVADASTEQVIGVQRRGLILQADKSDALRVRRS